MTKEAPIGVVTISDRASTGVYQDLGGPAMVDWLGKAISSPWRPVARLIADEQDVIEATLRELADVENCALIVTTGGTGPT